MWRFNVSLVVGTVFLVLPLGVMASLHFFAVPEKLDVVEIASAATQRLVVRAEAPVLTVRSYAIFDVESGEVLASDSGDTPYPIASITKLVSAAAAKVQDVPLESTTAITWSDLVAEGRAGKLEVAQHYTLRELLFPLLLESSNHAAAVLERNYGDALLVTMHEIAKEYGAAHSVFADASGLSVGNSASAHDLVKLTAGLYREHPFIFDVATLPQYIGTHTGWVNNNPVRSEGVYRGGKHGYTDAAKRTIVALFDEDIDDDVRTVGYVVLGSDDLRSDVAALRTFVQEAVHLE